MALSTAKWATVKKRWWGAWFEYNIIMKIYEIS
jgi:hypothetical protein